MPSVTSEELVTETTLTDLTPKENPVTCIVSVHVRVREGRRVVDRTTGRRNEETGHRTPFTPTVASTGPTDRHCTP